MISFFKKNWKLILLTISIGLIPSLCDTHISGGLGFELRAEDFILLFLGGAWIISLILKNKIERPPLAFPVLIWLGLGFFSVLVNFLFFNLKFTLGFFYFLKEIEFFFLFYFVFYNAKNNKESVKFFIKLWFIFGLIHISWIILELLTGIKYSFYYGPIIYMEPKGPYPSAGFILITFIFLANIFLYYYLPSKKSLFKKIIIGLIIASLTLGVLVSGSSTNYFAMFGVLFLSWLFYFIKVPERRILMFSIFILALVVLIIWGRNSLIDQIRGAMWEYSSKDYLSRVEILKRHVELFYNSSPFFIMFGRGVFGECHCQYIRIFLERGILGFLAFAFLIEEILRKSFWCFLKGKNAFYTAIAAGLFMITVVMLIIGIPADSFMSVKIAETYWYFTGLSFVILSANNEFGKI